jgi:nickel superoxide dismutase
MRIVSLITKFLPLGTIYAHCDIPCGIYDPHEAQLSAHTVIRMTDLLSEAGEDVHKIARLTRTKEDHAEKIKYEVRVIWGDYFKPEHLEKFPELHQLVFEIMKLASKAKQDIDRESAGQLLSKVQEFAEIFYKSKGVTPKRIKSLYPTEGEIVTYESE